jgi:hypothetical protein
MTGASRLGVGRWAFALVAVALLPVMMLASADFGVTWDEGARHRNGERVWRYLNGSPDRALFERGGHVYGGLFDVAAVAVESRVTTDRFVVRHRINAFFGWAGVVFAGALAARLFGIWTGVLAMVLLASSPRYFADSMNNPKDLPYAATSVAALWAISTMSSGWPYISRGTAFGLIAALGAALNVRPAALFNFGFFGLLLGSYVLVERTTDWRRLAVTTARVAIIVIAALVVGTAFWPWAQQAPLVRPIQALFEASDYHWAGQVLFEGRNYRAPDLPRYYSLRWMLISTPPVVLAGLVLACVPSSRGWAIRRLALAFVVLLPITLILIKGSTLYDGVRHLLFIYPAVVVLASSGWAATLSPARPRWARGLAAAALAAGIVNILVFQIRFHPNQTVYFNEFVGGPRAASARYDLDYWGNCVLQAVEWAAAKARAEGRPITVSGWPAHLVQLNAQRFPDLVFDRRDHEMLIRLSRGTRQAVLDLARREDALHRVETPDGAVLCVVLPGSAPIDPVPADAVPPDETSDEPDPAQ